MTAVQEREITAPYWDDENEDIQQVRHDVHFRVQFLTWRIRIMVRTVRTLMTIHHHLRRQK